MNTCALSGQAAAELAAMALESACNPGKLPQQDIDRIRLRLSREGMCLPGVFMEDPDDLAQKAQITASSWNGGFCTEEIGAFSLEKGGFITFPGVEKRRINPTLS